MAKVYTSRAQIIRISELLKEHLNPADGGLFSYASDWSDARVAEIVATEANPITAGHVLTVRAELFGNLRTSAPVSAVETRVAALTAELAAERSKSERLDSRLALIEELHAKLCLLVSVNQLVDARHLTGRAPSARLAAPTNGAHAQAAR